MQLEILNGAKPHLLHNWLLSTRLVAEGYGVKPETVRGHKANHSDEIISDRHYITEGQQTLWTQAGVIRLGMFIKSEQAIEFRNAAETHLTTAINAAKPSLLSVTVQNSNAPAYRSSPEMDSLIDDLADDILANEFKSRLDVRVQEKRSDRLALESIMEKLQLPIPKNWKSIASN